MDDDSISLQKMQVAGWIYLVMLTAGSWILVSWSFAWAVLAGGGISILSFSLSHRDVVGYFESLSSVPAEEQEGKEKVQKSKTGFLLRFWFRIGVIGIVLLLLIKSGKANVLGLILGLSTVVFTITLSALRAAGHYFFSGRR